MMDVLTLVPLNTQNPDDNEEIEIDIDKIDDATLRFLDNFVKEVKSRLYPSLASQTLAGLGQEEEENRLDPLVCLHVAAHHDAEVQSPPYRRFRQARNLVYIQQMYSSSCVQWSLRDIIR